VFALCGLALSLDMTGGALFAAGYGLGIFLAVMAVRRMNAGLWGGPAIAAVAAVVLVAIILSQPAIRTMGLALAFAPHGEDSLIPITLRLLADAPWTGTGAGSFATLLPIYQDAGDTVTRFAAPTSAAQIEVELGRAMLWAIVIVVLATVAVLLRGALRRGRDSFYPAAAAGSVLVMLVLLFCDNGMLADSSGIFAAAIAGLGFAQSRSRTVV
jgi:hypothetical protein